MAGWIFSILILITAYQIGKLAGLKDAERIFSKKGN